MLKNTYISLFILFLLSSCSKKLVYDRVVSSESAKEIASRSTDKIDRCNCLKNANYEPKKELAVVEDLKYLKTVFIFPNSSDRSRNWTGDDMIYYAKNLNRIGNDYLAKNGKMKLPEGNSTPALNIPWRYKMYKDKNTESGLAIYEAIDDNLYYYITRGKNRNNSSKEVIKKYGRHKEDAVNIFAMSHHPDSIASPTYKPSRVGISMGTSVKISGVLQSDLKGVWKMATLYNHEVGHTLGLRHSWYKNDGCDDTPQNPNCYSAKSSGKCKGPISNNMMDYNHSQRALTPCQISIVTKHLHNPKSRVRPMVVKDWCDYILSKSLIVNDSLHLNRHVDLKGDIIVDNGGYLKISCTTNMPKGGKIIVNPGATLELHGCTLKNDCGEYWGGIELVHKGALKAKLVTIGEVTIENVSDKID